MKNRFSIPILLCVLTVAPAYAQAPAVTPSPAVIPSRPIKNEPTATSSDGTKLTKFNLDFPGGTPKQLVAAIEKATARPLNVVIPDEYLDESIPALRMNQVNVAELFRAMELASLKTEPYRTGSYYGGGGGQSYSYQQLNTSLTFQTSGPLSDDSIWYFRGRQKVPDFSAWDTKPLPAKTCRFYALTPYLEQGMKVEDITTAIQTGWKMLGEKETPNISFHKETKLLIAVGEPGKLETIDSVLNALRPASEFTGGRRPGRYSDRPNTLIQDGAQPAPTLKDVPTPKPAPTTDGQP